MYLYVYTMCIFAGIFINISLTYSNMLAVHSSALCPPSCLVFCLSLSLSLSLCLSLSVSLSLSLCVCVCSICVTGPSEQPMKDGVSISVEENSSGYSAESFTYLVSSSPSVCGVCVCVCVSVFV